jgi:hypothetical protein
MAIPFSRNVNTFVVVTAVIVGVGALTWYLQFGPRLRSSPSAAPNRPAEFVDGDVLSFPARDRLTGTIRAVWEWDNDGSDGSLPRDSHYVLEYERLLQGYCYFAFRNSRNAPADFGVLASACDCAEVEACVLPKDQWEAADKLLTKTRWAQPVLDPEPVWHHFGKEKAGSFKVPAGAGGLLRIGWKGRKNYGEGLHIRLELYSQCEDGDDRVREKFEVLVPVRMAQPLLFDPKEAGVTFVGSGDTKTLDFYCWSPTRDNPDVSFQPTEPDPLFQVSSRKLTPAECKELQATLRKKDPGAQQGVFVPLQYRVRSAYHVKVGLVEQKDGRHRDLGQSSRTLPVRLDGEPVDFPTPKIVETVQGDVEVGSPEDRGAVQLQSFFYADDKSVVLPILSARSATLELVRHHPPLLKVELKRAGTTALADRARWELRVTVPARSWPGGPLPDNSEIVLRVVGTPASGTTPGTPTRLVHIPVVGTATR